MFFTVVYEMKEVDIMFEIPYNLLAFTNLTLLVWFLIDLYRGYKRGLLLQLLDWVTTFVALIVAWLFSSPFAEAFPWFYSAKGIGIASIDSAIALQVNRLVWLAIIFAVIRVALMILSPIASLISKMPLIKQVNSSIGGVFAVVFFSVKLVILCLFLSFPIITNGQDVIDQSVLKYVAQYSEPVFEWVDVTLGSNSAVQSIVGHQKLDEKQTESVIEWLRSLNFSTNEIMEFLNSYE